MMIELTEAEMQNIQALGQTIGTLGDIFKNGDGTPVALRMAIANLRMGADVLEGFCARWEGFMLDQQEENE